MFIPYTLKCTVALDANDVQRSKIVNHMIDTYDRNDQYYITFNITV